MHCAVNKLFRGTGTPCFLYFLFASTSMSRLIEGILVCSKASSLIRLACTTSRLHKRYEGTNTRARVHGCTPCPKRSDRRLRLPYFKCNRKCKNQRTPAVPTRQTNCCNLSPRRDVRFDTAPKQRRARNDDPHGVRKSGTSTMRLHVPP
jgi:hypothetical protein